MKKLLALMILALLLMVPAVYAQEDVEAATTDSVEAATDAVPAAEPAPPETPDRPHKGKEWKGKRGKDPVITATGMIEIIPKKDKERFDTVMLKGEKESWKLLPVKKFMEQFKSAEQAAGKTVTIEGFLKPANKRFPTAAISVKSCTIQE